MVMGCHCSLTHCNVLFLDKSINLKQVYSRKQSKWLTLPEHSWLHILLSCQIFFFFDGILKLIQDVHWRSAFLIKAWAQEFGVKKNTLLLSMSTRQLVNQEENVVWILHPLIGAKASMGCGCCSETLKSLLFPSK